jgi:hypothetical protein
VADPPPEQGERFKQNPAQLLKSATEECLHYDSSVKSSRGTEPPDMFATLETFIWRYSPRQQGVQCH